MLTRICGLCGEQIELSLPYSKKYVFYGTKNKWYHLDCLTAIVTPRTNIGDWIDKTESRVLRLVSMDNVCQLFYKHYNMDYISTRLFKKLDQIYDGTYKGLAQPIPPHELYDILRRKMKYLDSNATYKGLKGEQRVNYDLAVAMGSYSSYKAWLASIKAEQEQQEELQKQSNADPDRYKLRGYVPPSEPSEVQIDYEATIE